MYNIFNRQSCPKGAYYVCQNGFKGCCSTDPCGTEVSCLDDDSGSPTAIMLTTTQRANTATPLKSVTTAIQTTLPKLTEPKSTSTTMSTSTNDLTPPTFEAGSIIQRTTSTVTRDISGLTCPASNSTTVTDSNRNSYNIRCSMDNVYTSFSTIDVSSGGFSGCFNACDNLTACAGFTFVGLDDGSCYLKQSMPNDAFVAKAGSNYVSGVRVTKVDVVLPPSTSSTLSTSTGGATATSTTTSTVSPMVAHSSKPNAGVIAGATVGGVATILFILLLLALLVRRGKEKKRTETDRAATKTETFLGPTEHPSKGEVFAPYGGFYREGIVSRKTDDSQMTASTFRTHDYSTGSYLQKDFAEDTGPVQLDGRPIYKDSLREPPGHTAEMADTSFVAVQNKQLSPASVSSESPVLGRNTVGSMRMPNNIPDRQHMMSWNNYDDREAMSLPSAMSSGLSPMVISPPDDTPVPPAGYWHRAPQGTQPNDQPYQYR